MTTAYFAITDSTLVLSQLSVNEAVIAETLKLILCKETVLPRQQTLVLSYNDSSSELYSYTATFRQYTLTFNVNIPLVVTVSLMSHTYILF